jgi:predicted membrane metal-binding protein
VQNDRNALTNGLLFGSDAGFSSELVALTRAAGVTHLVAASGANLRFVEGLWSGVFGRFGGRFVQYSSLVAVLAYWGMAEQSGSLWRASLMWSITWLGRLMGKRIPLWYSLGVTVLLTGILAQEFLTPGFWLSALAMVGIFFSRRLRSGEKKSPLFPHSQSICNSVAKSLTEGTLVFVMVTLWLWTQYQVFEPVGILSTFVLGFLVDPLVWLGISEKVSGTVPVGWISPLSVFHSAVVFLQTAVFFLFWELLLLLANSGTCVPKWAIGIAAAWLILRQLSSWRRGRARTQTWQRFCG